MKKSFYILPLFILMLSPYTFFAQKEKHSLREGNNQYNNGRYAESEKYYSDALKKRNDYYKANFNLGDAYYKQGKLTDAIGQYDAFIKNNNNKDTLSKAFHNMGNAYLKTKSYEDAVKAYKNSLKFNPKDEDTRYNLAYALKKLEEQKKKEQQKKDQDKKENKDNKDDKGQPKKDDQKKDGDKKQEQKSQMSKEEAQRMLESLKNAEQKLQLQKKPKGDKEAEKKNIEKDW
ncbi:MAG: tetratricopeptide repeat protein [Bacteroidia bacterium]